jgi:hypothetical protein
MEENKGKRVALRKVNLESFIEVLTDLYESGVNYVDIYGTDGEEQDVIDIHFTREYTIFKDDVEEEEEEEDVPQKDIDLSDDNLNQII